MMDDDKKTHLGRGWAFPLGFIKGAGAEMACEEEDIRQSLEILFSTARGERLMRFDYGCNLRKWVYDEMNLSARTMIADAIRQAVLFHEPRIEVLTVEVGVRRPDEGILWIDFSYRVRQTNSRSNMVYPFYFREGTDL